VKYLTNSPSEIRYIPYDEAYEEGFEDMPLRKPDLRKIQQLIDYHPLRNLREIVQDVIDYFQREEHV